MLRLIEDNPKDGEFLVQRDDQKGIRVCVYPMMFGFRIRVYTDADPMHAPVDYCAGVFAEDVSLIYSLVAGILTKGTSVDDFPTFKTKPMVYDKPCMDKLLEMVPHNYARIIITEEMLSSIRLRTPIQ